MNISILLKWIEKDFIDAEDLLFLVDKDTDLILLAEEYFSSGLYESAGRNITKFVFAMLAYKDPEKAKELLDKYTIPILNSIAYIEETLRKESFLNKYTEVVKHYITDVLVTKMENLNKKYKIVKTVKENHWLLNQLLKPIKYNYNFSYSNFNSFEKAAINLAKVDYYIGYNSLTLQFNAKIDFTYNFRMEFKDGKLQLISNFNKENKEIEDIKKKLLSIKLPESNAKQIYSSLEGIIKFIKEVN